eukprot:TRINITY_DN11301_c0_g1_i2.p1 TRINITY_DN11301_c0_g1~~TRINITY_DN11301_c0_g1_i2.p1  ORF type:complete len:385 (+),score=99.15 TRINITY_DN11301_c0_g1_i2:320-1474(+)
MKVEFVIAGLASASAILYAFIQRQNTARRLQATEKNLTASQAALSTTASEMSHAQQQLASSQTVLTEMQKQLEESSRLREMDRAGRTRVEKELRALRQKQLSEDGWAMRPIGTIQSCFRERNGTPRQACLVPDARAVLRIRPDLNPASISDGLAEFSHVWIVFVFHENTNAARHAGLREDVHAAASPPIKVKVKPPRHDKKVGVFATRTPHRPNPIGLSLVKLDGINEDGSLRLSAIDLVDGTPVLDVKPFIPGYDLMPDSDVRIAQWLHEPAVAALTEPTFTPEARAQLEAIVPKLELYKSADDAVRVVSQVLRLDIRSKNRRKRQQDGVEAAQYSVGIDTMSIVFEIGDEQQVTVVSVVYWPRGTQRPHLQHGAAVAAAADD